VAIPALKLSPDENTPFSPIYRYPTNQTVLPETTEDGTFVSVKLKTPDE
jgi:hypothetical protein